MNNQNKILTYLPQSIVHNAIFVYVLALLSCTILYNKYSLVWYWILFGIVEVVAFFYFSNKISKEWENLGRKSFSRTLFKTSFIIRFVYVLLSYLFYYEMTGTEFDFGAADVIFYNDAGRYLAECIKNGHWNLFDELQKYSGTSFSDSGYCIYLSTIYVITDNSIIFTRLLKALWSAWTVLLIYKLAQRNFGESVARIASIMCMLMPNLIYYCGLHLKEVEMVFLEILYVERVDSILREKSYNFTDAFILGVIILFLFTMRTALAVVLILALGFSLLLSKDNSITKSRKVLLIVAMTFFTSVMFIGNTSIGKDVINMWQTGSSQQATNMEWRSTRKDSQGRTQKFARYAGAVVFAPMIFTIPFPTMVETEGQENQKMIHGGNFVKNITSFFTILTMFVMLLSGRWRQHVLPIAVLCGYLGVLVFSSFAHSERFHLPTVPLALMFAAYGISVFKTKIKYQRWFTYWCVLMYIAAVSWNWFKLAGRGMI